MKQSLETNFSENNWHTLNRGILNSILNIAAICVIPATFFLYIRSVSIEDSTSVLIASGIFYIVTIFNILCKKTRTKIKAYLLIASLIILFTASIYNLGLFASGKYNLVLIMVVSILFLTTKEFIRIVALCVIIYLAFAYLYISKQLQYNFSLHTLGTDTDMWLTDIWQIGSTTLVVGLVIFRIIAEYKKHIIKIEESKNIFVQFIKNLPTPAILIDKNFNILNINNKYTELLGHTSTDIPNVATWFDKMFPTRVEAEKMKRKWNPILYSMFKDSNTFIDKEIELVDRLGNKKSLELNYAYFDNKVVLTFNDITLKKQHRKDILNAMINAEEGEKSRMAKELHDGIGPLVSTAKIYAQTGLAQMNGNNQTHAERLVTILDEILDEIHNISNNISPHVLRNYGLSEGIRSFVRKLIPVSKIHFKLFLPDEIHLIDTQQITIYRVLIELINNSVKYANASAITIRYKEIPDLHIFYYMDDGNGFIYNESDNKSFGLENMRSRILALGGQYKMMSQPLKGVRVVIKINKEL